jgi:hypothetical protein
LLEIIDFQFQTLKKHLFEQHWTPIPGNGIVSPFGRKCTLNIR